MSIQKTITIGSISLFILIGSLAIFKKEDKKKLILRETSLKTELTNQEIVYKEVDEKKEEPSAQYLQPVLDEVADKDVDLVWRLFTKDRYKLSPIVETISYKSRVPWLKDRSAWITDYASHYSTSRHFIARSLNEKVDYYTQKISAGDTFNILKKDLNFRLIIDLSRCKMWFYTHNLLTDECYLLKTYKVGVGRLDSEMSNELRTPIGKFILGEKIAIYKPGITSYFQGNEVEMVQVFGTRWIPFGKELSGEGDDPKGYGFHGAAWIYDEHTKEYTENLTTIGKYESDGCVHMGKEDIEELFSIVITKPTIVEIVTDFHDAEIPGNLIEIEK